MKVSTALLLSVVIATASAQCDIQSLLDCHASNSVTIPSDTFWERNDDTNETPPIPRDSACCPTFMALRETCGVPELFSAWGNNNYDDATNRILIAYGESCFHRPDTVCASLANTAASCLKNEDSSTCCTHMQAARDACIHYRIVFGADQPEAGTDPARVIALADELRVVLDNDVWEDREPNVCGLSFGDSGCQAGREVTLSCAQQNPLAAGATSWKASSCCWFARITSDFCGGDNPDMTWYNANSAGSLMDTVNGLYDECRDKRDDDCSRTIPGVYHVNGQFVAPCSASQSPMFTMGGVAYCPTMLSNAHPMSHCNVPSN